LRRPRLLTVVVAHALTLNYSRLSVSHWRGVATAQEPDGNAEYRRAGADLARDPAGDCVRSYTGDGEAAPSRPPCL